MSDWRGKLSETASMPARPSWGSRLRDAKRCVTGRDPAARSRLEAWPIYPGVRAIAAHRIAHVWRLRGWRDVPRRLSFLARMVTHADIHPGATHGERFVIEHGAGVATGNDVTRCHGLTPCGTGWHPGKRHPTPGGQVIAGAGMPGPIDDRRTQTARLSTSPDSHSGE